MSFFKRLRDVTLANIYALIETVEDPVKMIDQYLRDMMEDLEDAEKAVVGQIAIEKKFKQLYEEQEQLMKKRDQQAHIAAKAQNTDLARKAIEGKKAAEQKMNEYKTSYEQNKIITEKLREKLDNMRKQVSELKNKRDTLVARAQTAKAQQEINKMMSGIDSSSAMAGLKRMEEKVMSMEAQAEASDEVYHQETSLDEEIQRLNREKEIEEELAELLNQNERENR
ncbi:PspA/IM30 family protein [Neobacillus sp. SM06]|uniref:PspA/IM30 family protein n=1 Tax=Neobacillus sp. SM06 TaxID=3422492 RepID=UPI003D287A16